jgi:MFS family permease
MFKKIPKPVVVLGFVSFLNDVASEMIYPLVPIFLSSILHVSYPIIGLVEGLAEATASITKYFFGTYSDYLKKRKIFVVCGYSLSAISKVLIGLSYVWPFVLFGRFADRLGKGVRTAPRDSLLLENATQENNGYIFGFHRAFDSHGAVIGPLIALLFLVVFKENMRLVFFIAFIPGFFAVLLLIVFIKEQKLIKSNAKQRITHISWKSVHPHLKVFLLVSILFALGNSSDVFLILRAKSLGFTTTLAVFAYVVYNISQTLFATHAGKLADKIGAKKVYIMGLMIFSIVYLLFGLTTNSVSLWFLFALYGVYIAFTDGVSKAYISEFIKKEESGTYFGAYYALTAIATLFASVIAGLLWTHINSSMVFIYGCSMAVFACIVFVFNEFIHKKSKYN